MNKELSALLPANWRLLLSAGTATCSVLLVTYLARDYSIAGRPQNVDDIQFRPIRLASFAHYPHVGGIDADEVLRRLRLNERRIRRVPALLHAIRLYGSTATLASCSSLDSTVMLESALLDNFRKEFVENGVDSLVRTRHGARAMLLNHGFNGQFERESHRDQFLAVLAEAGISADRSIRLRGGQATVQEMVSDTAANFNATAREIEWTAVALALYLPPKKMWVDKFGQSHDFNELADELAGRSLGQATACGGLHLLYAMTVLLRVDEVSEILNDRSRSLLRGRLDEARCCATLAQHIDGWWDSSWSLRISNDADTAPRPSSDSRLLTTGHQIEWFALLPVDLRPPDECFVRACRWLAAELLSADEDFVSAGYCPCSHAARVVAAMCLPRKRKEDRAAL